MNVDFHFRYGTLAVVMNDRGDLQTCCLLKDGRTVSGMPFLFKSFRHKMHQMVSTFIKI